MRSAADGTDLGRRLGWLDDGTAFFLRAMDLLRQDGDFRGPSLLPGWTRAHVLSHVARNADALCNLVAWARSGEPTPMYASPGQRERDIEEGAAASPALLCADVRASADRLTAAIITLPPGAWAATVRTARGRQIPAAEIPWLRIREVWVHGIDLACGAGFSDLPQPLVDTLLGDAATVLTGQPDCPAISLQPTDRAGTWAAGEGPPRSIVTGPAADLLAWVTGRAAGSELQCRAGLPRLPAWL